MAPAKKGQQRCPIFCKLPEIIWTYKPKMIATKAHRIFGRVNFRVLIFNFLRWIFYFLAICILMTPHNFKNLPLLMKK